MNHLYAVTCILYTGKKLTYITLAKNKSEAECKAKKSRFSFMAKDNKWLARELNDSVKNEIHMIWFDEALSIDRDVWITL